MLAGIPSFQLDRLHSVMNAAAQLVFQISLHDHITLQLSGMVYPTYLADALQPVARIPGRQRLRISSTSALDVPSTRLSTVGDRVFPVAVARTWSSLPAEVTSSNSLQTFKTKLNIIYSCRRFRCFHTVFVQCPKCFGNFFTLYLMALSIYIAHYRTVPVMRSVHRVLLKQMRLK